MQFNRLKIPDIVLIQPKVFVDERGFFLETYRQNEYANAGITQPFVQENHSKSRQGVLRGLHYQIQQAQGKLVRVVLGEIFDVAVDLRRSSTTYGHWVGQPLSSANKYQMWIPPGFAHGFYVLSEWVEVIYKTTNYWAPEWERTLLWNDPDINIQWPIPQESTLSACSPLLSPKDTEGVRLIDLPDEDIFE